MGVILAVGNAVWEKEVGSLFQSYLPWDPPVDNFLFSAFLSFWSYVIILNTVVPISLYVRWADERPFKNVWIKNNLALKLFITCAAKILINYIIILRHCPRHCPIVLNIIFIIACLFCVLFRAPSSGKNVKYRCVA